MNYTTRITLSILSLLFLSPCLYSQLTTTWQGGTSDTEWHEETFWSNGVPDPNTVAIIDNGGLVIINQNAEAAGIIINGSGGILNINATLDVNVQGASPTIGIDMAANVSFINIGGQGTLFVRNASSFGIQALGQVTNDGEIIIENCGIGINNGTSANARFENRGKISITNSANNAIAVSTGIFINAYCGYIDTAEDNIFSGIFENIGVISTSSTSNSLIAFTTTLGVIHNLGGAVFFDADFDEIVTDTNPTANYWRGCSSAAWNDDCNWSRNHDPMDGDSVVIASGGTGSDPELSTISDTVMHVSNADTLTIKDQGRLVVSGATATSPIVGISSQKKLTVEAGGSIHVMQTSATGILCSDECANQGEILVEDATNRSIGIFGATTTFVNDGLITITGNDPSTTANGLEITNGIITNNGQIGIIGAQIGISNFETFTNHGNIDITNSTLASIVHQDFSAMTNANCAIITTDNPFFLNPNSTMTNNGLINYTGPSVTLSGTYTDDGFQYDPNDVLPDGTNTQVLSFPRTLIEFNIDLDGDGTSFCEGDLDDITITLECGVTLTDQTTVGGTNNLDGYSCRSASFTGPERIYSFEVTAPDTLVLVQLSNETVNTDIFILSDPSDPTSCIAHGFDRAAAVLSPGTYFIAVDGFGGASGSFDLSLDCMPVQSEPMPITCGETLSDQNNLGNFLYDDYSCSFNSFVGPERIYSFEVTAPDTLAVVQLSNETTRTDIFILSDPSDPTSCIVHGSNSAAAVLSPGTYFIAIDGSNGASGSFDLSLDCMPVQSEPMPITCGETLSDQNNLGNSLLDAYPCRNYSFSGPERIYTFEVTAPDTLITVQLSNETANTDIFILSDPADPSSCIAHGNSQIAAILSPGTYFIAIDGFNGASGSFDLSLDCMPVQSEPMPITCGETLSDQNNLANSLLDAYPCRNASFTGPERIYTFEVTAPDTLITVQLSNETANTDIFILSDPADPSSCIAHGNSQIAAILSPGTYFIAIDGFNGASGSFDLSLDCMPVQSEPMPITCGETLSDQNNLANSLLDAYPCRNASFTGPERIYTFEVTAPDTLVSVQLSNEMVNTDIFILSDPIDPSSCIAHGTSQIAANLSPGTYFIVVDGFGGNFGSFDLSLACTNPAISGITCSSAIPIICGTSIEGSLSEAFIDPNNNQGCDLDRRGLWYEFPGTGDMVTVSLCDTDVSFDSELTVLIGGCGSLTCNGTQNDDGCSFGGLSELTLPTVIGETYWVRVTQFFGGDGDFTLTLTCEDDEGCIPQRLESGMLDQSVYAASEKILSDGSISSPNMIRMSAPEVELLPGFEVTDGQLEVDQEGCQ